MEETVRSQFNQILIKHYERLTGTKNAAGGLPLTLDNIGCLILFGGRELEMADINSEVSARYTMEEFLKEVQDTGIESGEHFQAAMQELMQKKYIEQRPDGRVYGYSDAKETARILNRVFPKMQGVNLLAYIWQTIAEVMSGRTDLESALSRFDQTLNNHGVVPPKPKIPVITTQSKLQDQPAVEGRKESDMKRSRSRSVIRDYVVTEAPIRSIPKISKPDNTVVPDINPERAQSVKTVNEATPSEAYQEHEGNRKATEIDQKSQAEAEAMKQKIAELERAIAAAEKEKQAIPPEVAVPIKKEEPVEVCAANDTPDTAPVDDEIARKIAAFEKELALVCPICKAGVLQEKSTVAGKVFYTCASAGCNFISWGRPHNIPCARCKNPFLIEATDAAGQAILRCPRATCQHRQPLNAAPGVKVVRKRIVRRPK